MVSPSLIVSITSMSAIAGGDRRWVRGQDDEVRKLAALETALRAFLVVGVGRPDRQCLEPGDRTDAMLGSDDAP
jgi:hypothetical protein